MKKVTTLFSVLVITLFGFMNLQAQEALIISEYIEGSSNNKAIELFNTTGAAVSLENYQIAQSNNGGGWQYYHEFPVDAEIAAKGTYVIITDQVSSELFDAADADEVLGYPSVVHHNGNDARAIIHISGEDTTLIDVIGIPDSDAYWDVAGVSEATREHTLVRKSTVTGGNTDWAASAGTNADDSEWIVYDQNNFYHLGSHAFGEYDPEPENGTIVNVNSDFLDAELGPTTGIPDWWILGADYVDYEFVADPDNNSNNLLKATVTDIANAANPWDAQVATVNNMLEANSTYIISTRLKYESVSEAATGTINFTSGDVGIHQYGLSVNNDAWTVATLDTVKTDTAVAANVGLHLAYDNHEDGDVFNIDYIRVVKLDEEGEEPAPPSTDQIVWNFEDPADINSWTNGANSSQEFAANADATEGLASLDWTYTVDPSEDWGGSADIQLTFGDYLTDLSEFDGFSFDYKTLTPADPSDGGASLVVKVYVESTGGVEEYHYTVPNVLSDESSEWQTANVFFEDLAIPSWLDTFDGELYPDKIVEIQMQIIVGSGGSETSGQVLVDNMVPATVSLPIPEPPYAVGDNLSYNGSFQEFDLGILEDNSYAKGWYNNNISENATFEIVSDSVDEDQRAVKVDVGTWDGSENRWHVELVNEPLNVVSGETYEVSFWSKADSESRHSVASLVQSEEGGFSLKMDYDYNLTTDWQENLFSFTANNDDEEFGLRFALAMNYPENDGAIFHFDNIQITKVSDTEVLPGKDWSFEGSDFGGFEVIDEVEYNTGGSGELSTEQAQEGSQSVKITSLSGRSYTDFRNTTDLDTLEAGGKLTYHVWVSEEDLDYVRYFQPFVQHGENWQQWTSNLYQPYVITPGEWNIIELVVPEAEDGIYQSFGIQMTGYHAKNEGQPVMYVDNVIYESPGEHSDKSYIAANEADSLALVDFYNGTNGDEWINSTNWLQTPVQQWHGVALNSEGRVAGLNLPNNNMVGELPESFSGLTKANWLEFSGNPELTGPIFGRIAGYDNMIDLYIANCNFSGDIPQEIGNHTNFYLIVANQNQISGTLPDSIGNLVHLNQMVFWNNNIEGAIPSTIGNLTSLRGIDFGNNNLSGEIPEEFFGLTNLEAIWLYNNNLVADFNDFVAFESLWVLAIQGNQIGGSIPPEIQNLSQLDELRIEQNQISGAIPAEIGNLENLRALVTWGNQFEGGIPSEVGNLSNLVELNIGNEGLGGTIPASIGQLENLVYLRLNSAGLTGNIPVELGNLSNLQTLYLNNNNLEGEIPVELSNLTELRLMYLYENQDLSGTLPAEFGQLENLQRLSINNVGISGTIPVEWGNLQNLNFLRLENTQLEGMLPGTFTNLENLNTFNISDTQVIIPTDIHTKLWVEGIDDFASSNWVDLTVPELVMPANSETALAVPTLLTWNGPPNADRYLIEIYGDEALEDTVDILELNSNSWVSIENLDYNSTYYWRVMAGVSYGFGEWSEVFSFKTQLDSEAGPALLTPENEADSVGIPVTFTWDEVAGAQNYYLEISLVPSFDTTATVKELSGTEFTLEEAMDATDYFWRVRAEADGEPGGWSAVGTFATELRPPETPSWEPEDGAEDVPVESMLAWNASERAATYNLQLSDDEDFSNLLVDETELDSTQYAVSLDGETTYYWRIQAANSSGLSEWSTVASFTTEMTTGYEEEEAIPEEFAMHQNYPNPFNPSTVISYQLPENSPVRIEVFDMVGRKVATVVNEHKSAGRYTVTFDASHLSSGMYIYRIKSGDFMETKKMMLIK